MADTTILKHFDSDQQILFPSDAEKKPGSACYERWQQYRKAKTIGEALKLGATKADLRWDAQKGLLKLVGNAAGLQAGSTPMKRPAAAAASGTPSAKAARTAGGGLRAVASAAAAKTLRDGVQLKPTLRSGGASAGSGVVLPAVGYGTYKLKGAEVKEPMLAALRQGYRLFDTAQVYENEADVGRAIRESGVPREEIVIETKVWRSSHGYERTMKAFNQSLRKLGVDYIDLYLIHWPGAKTGWPLKKGTICPPDWTPAMRDTGTWKAMEELLEKGKVKAIGVANYGERQLKQLLKVCKIKPMVNQVEFHPRLVQSELLEFCKANGIVLQAYASLGSSDAKQAETFFQLPPVQKAAEAHKATPAQVLLRWALQKGALVVPKSSKASRIQENSEVFHFSLTKSEVSAIDALHNGTRLAWKGEDPGKIE
mmetsp:Transcript_11332/g.24981  ORF Transcript_11332/g.24981 Transcript_11332/m.24981 type:complete len:426 (-) Transcript_11332:68-1345(-)